MTTEKRTITFDPIVNVTKAAFVKIMSQLQRRGGIGIRVGVKTTGCSGLAYVLEYVDKLTDGDDTIIFEGFSIIINN